MNSVRKNKKLLNAYKTSIIIGSASFAMLLSFNALAGNVLGDAVKAGAKAGSEASKVEFKPREEGKFKEEGKTGGVTKPGDVRPVDTSAGALKSSTIPSGTTSTGAAGTLPISTGTGAKAKTSFGSGLGTSSPKKTEGGHAAAASKTVNADAAAKSEIEAFSQEVQKTYPKDVKDVYETHKTEFDASLKVEGEGKVDDGVRISNAKDVLTLLSGIDSKYIETLKKTPLKDGSGKTEFDLLLTALNNKVDEMRRGNNGKDALSKSDLLKQAELFNKNKYTGDALAGLDEVIKRFDEPSDVFNHLSELAKNGDQAAQQRLQDLGFVGKGDKPLTLQAGLKEPKMDPALFENARDYAVSSHLKKEYNLKDEEIAKIKCCAGRCGIG